MDQSVANLWTDRKLADPLFNIPDIVDLFIRSDLLPCELQLGFIVSMGRTPANITCTFSTIYDTNFGEEFCHAELMNLLQWFKKNKDVLFVIHLLLGDEGCERTFI